MRISDWSSDVCSSDLGNRLWHGGREKERAAAIRRRVQYFFQFLTKTHVEHFVGFVENHGSQCACAKFAAFQMIAQTAWRTNDDMRPLRQLPLLIAYIHAPDTGDNARSGLFVEPFQLTLNLQRQFTGGRNYRSEEHTSELQSL